MAVTRICGCTVVFWCYLILFFDLFVGFLFAMKHLKVDWFDLGATANKASFWGRADRCLDLGLGKVGLTIEMSLLIISVIALLGLCCRKSKLLIPYLILKVIVIVIYIYMGVMYAKNYKNCGGWLFAQALAIVFSLVSYAIVAGTYKMSSVTIELIPSQKRRKAAQKPNSKAGNLALLEDYLYDYEKGGFSQVLAEYRHYWRCIDRSCKARITTNANEELVNQKGDHSHPPSQQKLYKKLATARLAIALENEDVSVSAAVTPILDDFPKDERMPTPSSFKKCAYRIRNSKQNLPSVPPTYLDFEIPEELKSFKGGDFFRGMTDDKRIAVFASDQSLKLLEEQKIVYGDGTFRVSPSIYYQLYILHVQWKSTRKTVPVIYALMAGKTKQDYEKLFMMLKDLAPRFNPHIYTSDFESACIKAFETVFPQAETRTCYFHLAQSFRRHADANSLKNLIFHDKKIKRDFRMLRAIAFVPLPDLISVWDSLIEFVDPRLSPIVEWFNNTYIGKIKITGERATPRFAHESWNVFKRTHDGESRTNNGVEGTNNALRDHFEQEHPNPFKFIKKLISFQEKTDITVRDLIENGYKPLNRSSSYSNQQSLCLRYADFDPIDFLYQISMTFD